MLKPGQQRQRGESLANLALEAQKESFSCTLQKTLSLTMAIIRYGGNYRLDLKSATALSVSISSVAVKRSIALPEWVIGGLSKAPTARS